MNCSCDLCKFSRGEITADAYRRSLNEDIEKFKKILTNKQSSEEEKQDAELNSQEACCLLAEIQD